MYSLALQLILEKPINWQLVNNIKGSSVKRNTAASTYQYERSYAPVGSMAVGKTNTSRSEPDMAWLRSMPKRSVPPQRLLSNRGTYRAERANCQFFTSTASQPLHTMNGTGQTKTNTQLICSQVDSAPPKPPVTKCDLKSKVDW